MGPQPSSNSLVPSVSFLLVLLGLTTLLSGAITAPSVLAESSASACNLDSQAWVLDHIRKGELDLSTCPEDQRVLPAERLKMLLTQPLDGQWEAGEPRVLVHIKGAIFAEPVNLQGLTIRHRVALIECQFREDANFSHSLMLKPISFRGSSFTSANFSEAEFKDRADFQDARFTELANFQGIRVGGTAFFNKAIFAGAVKLQNAIVSRQFQAPGTWFMNDVTFDRINVGGTAFFNDAIFEGNVHFRDAVIERQLQGRSARFRSPKGTVSFTGIYVGDGVVLDHAVFSRGIDVDFRNAKVRDDFRARAVDFLNVAHEISFEGMRVNGTADFTETSFWGWVTFRRANIQRLEAARTAFNDVDGIQDFGEMQIKNVASFGDAAFLGHASFHAMQVGDEAVFSGAYFAGLASFKDATITGDFLAVNARFIHTEEPVSFEGMEVGNKAGFERSTFAGPVSFARTKLRQLVLSRATFGDTRFSDDGALTMYAEEVSFKEMQVAGTAYFVETEFQGPVIFSRAEFGRLEAQKARFHDEQLQDFSWMRVAGSASFDQANFAGSVTFQAAHVGREAIFRESHFAGDVFFQNAVITDALRAPKATFSNPAGQVSLQGMRVGNEVNFSDVVFRGAVIFRRSEFYRLEAERIQFLNRDQYQDFGEMRVENSASFQNGQFKGTVNFQGMQVGHEAIFSDARFAKGVYFDNAVITGNLRATQTLFTDFEEPVSFQGMQVGNEAIFERATFRGPVNFNKVKSYQFVVSRAQFGDKWLFEDGKAGEISFKEMQIGGTAFLKQSEFWGPVIFSRSDLGRLQAQGAMFYDPHVQDFAEMRVMGTADFEGVKFTGPVNFQSLQVGNDALFGNAHFADIVFFNEAVITSTFRANMATFSEAAIFERMKVGNIVFAQSDFKEAVDFNRIQVDHLASFIGTRFDNKLVMKNALLANLTINSKNGTEPSHDTTIGELDLSGTIVQRDFGIENIKADKLKANFLQVGGPSLVQDLEVKHELDFSNSTFQNITLCNVNISQAPNTLKLHGITFKHIGTPENTGCKGPWNKVLNDLPKDRFLPWIFKPFSVKQAEYSPSFYANLGTFFMNQGAPDEAERVFITQKWHERSAASASLKRLWNFFIHITVGDGRRPELAFLWSALVILIGCWVFERKGMEQSNRSDTPPPYNRLWYSLDAFTPIINLKAESRWQPRANRRYAQIYVQIHTFLGWILIPTGLAAFAGIVQ